MHEVIIIVLPKPNKAPLLTKSYRPIPLLQVDIKMLVKVLASQLNQVILSLVHLDQTGLMPGKNTAINIMRLIMNIQASQTIGTRLVVTLDAAKAFD